MISDEQPMISLQPLPNPLQKSCAGSSFPLQFLGAAMTNQQVQRLILEEIGVIKWAHCDGYGGKLYP